MDRLIVIWLLCLLDAGGLLMVVTAQPPTVSAVILTPEADRKEGQLVEMVCTASNLATSNIVVWETEDPEQSLRWGENTISTQSRFVFDTRVTSSSSTAQYFNIMNVQRSDTDEYVCSVYEPIPTGGSTIVVSSKVTLSVLYFPSSSFPVCSPAGPVTLNNGANFNPTCSSEIGNPAVAITVSQHPSQSNTHTWTSSSVGSDTMESSLELIVTPLLNNVTFECTITSSFRFPDMRRSCTIGPVNVEIIPTSVKPTEMITSISDTTVPSNAAVSNLAVIAGAAAGGLVAILLIAILIIICFRRGLCRRRPPKDSELTAGHGQPNLEPTTETPHQSYNEYAGLESSSSSRDGGTTATSPTTAPPRLSESSGHLQTGPIYALPNKTKPTMDVRRHPSSTEQNYANPVFGQDIVELETRHNETDRPVAMIKPMSTKPPPKPQPYQPKSKTPDDNLNHQKNRMPLQSPTKTPHQDGFILPPDPTYAEVSSPTRQQSNHGNQDGIVYADLDLQSETSLGNIQSSPTEGQVVYAMVKSP